MEVKSIKSHRVLRLFFLLCLSILALYLSRFINHSKYSATYDNVQLFSSVNAAEKSFTNFSTRVSPWVSTKSHQANFRDTFSSIKVSEYPIGPDNLTEKDKYFIYRCDERTMSFCGGYADRIKGIITAYMIANLTGRTFKAEMLLASCDFHRFIVPNQIDWYLPESFHKKVVPGPHVSKLDIIDNNGFVNGVTDDFLAMSWRGKKYVYFKGNRDRAQRFQSSPRYQKQLSWMANLSYDEINAALYRRLFRPSQYLLDKLKSFLQRHLEPNNKLVCAHIRIGKNPTMPTDFGPRIEDKQLPVIWKFLETFVEKKNDSRIFFMTDSDQLISKVKQLPFGDRFFFSPGHIVHVDRSPKISAKLKCEGLEKVIFEQLVLMHCDVLMISRSGISRFAAYIRGSDSGLYCFLDSGIVMPCKRNEILQIYGIKLGPKRPS